LKSKDAAEMGAAAWFHRKMGGHDAVMNLKLQLVIDDGSVSHQLDFTDSVMQHAGVDDVYGATLHSVTKL
jgi:hypothetical protein